MRSQVLYRAAQNYVLLLLLQHLLGWFVYSRSGINLFVWYAAAKLP